MLSRASAVLAVSLLAASAAQANWFSNKVAANIDRKIGNGVEAIAQPTIDSAEAAGRRVLQDADNRAGARLDQVNALVGNQVSGVNVLLEQRIGQVDAIAATRLAQVDKMVDKDIKQIDAIAAKNIDRIDALIHGNLINVDGMLKRNIDDVDDRIGARIDQVDQLTEQRFGNVETFAAKSVTALSAAVLWLIAFACLAIFAAAAVWRIYKESSGAWPADGSLWSRISAWWRKVHSRLGWQLASAAVCIGLLFFGFAKVIPTGSSERLVETHRAALDRSLAALDLPEAKYHASQLKILDPTNGVYRGMALKIDLLRNVLSRPALYQTAAGIHQTLSRIEQAEAQFGDHKDRDIETLQALIVFRTNPTREGEHDAAMLCATALEQGEDESGFALRPLAISYAENYLSHPLADADIEKDPDAPKEYPPAQLASLVQNAKSRGNARALTPLSHVLTFDALVRELLSKSMPAYRRMIEMHAQVAAASPERRAAAIAARKAAAREVIAAWESFDDALASRHSIDETSAAYAVFLLDDAIVTRARAYERATDANVPLPLNEKNYPQAAVRAHMLPPRVMWAKRYLGASGSGVQQVLSFQEADRFRRDEAAAYEFEKAYVEYLRATDAGHGYRAALAAASLGVDIDPPLTADERKAVGRAARQAEVAYL